MNKPISEFDIPSHDDDIETLIGLDSQTLRQKWKALLKSAPPKLRSAEQLARALAYRLQAAKHGDLSPELKRRLTELAERVRKSGPPDLSPLTQLRPGTVLVREWKGLQHAVTVEADGFRLGAALYPSLTAAAGTITGTHWSGRRFFGLDRKSIPKDCKSP